MALTRPTFQNLNSNLTTFSDPITITNFGNVANRDIGLLFDRSQGSVSNVAIFWQESTSSFMLAYTSSTGKDTGNLTATGNANLRVGNITSAGNIYSNNRVGFTYSGNTTSVVYQVYNSATNSIDTIFG